MSTLYNRIAGQSVERLAALSDGIFAVAMTLLVLDLRAPLTTGIQSEHDLLRALFKLAPQLIMYAMSFLTLGIFWTGQQTQLNHFARTDRHLTWIHIAFLFAVSVMPFSTKLLAEFITFRLALVLYWGNILTLGVALYASWQYAARTSLIKSEVTPEVGVAVKRRIVIAQSLYACGALLCVINTACSIGFIVLVQLYYVVAPRIPGSGPDRARPARDHNPSA